MKRLTVLGLSCVVGLLTTLAAQAPTPAEYVTVATIKVRPAAVMEAEDYLKKINIAATKLGLKVRADVYQTVQGGSPYQYDVVSAFSSLAAIGEMPTVPAMLIKAHGEAEGNKILRAGRSTIESVEFTTLRYLPEMSIKPRPPVGSPFFQLTEVQINPEMATEYAAYLRKLKAARDKQASAPTALRHNNAFGPGFIYLIASPFDSWAEREKWGTPDEALRAMYDEAEVAQLTDIRERSVRAVRTWVVAHRRDLSRIPVGTTTN